MEDSRWFRLIIIGLILAALAVGYFLLSGRLISNSAVKTTPQATNVSGTSASAAPSASVLGQNAKAVSPNPSPKATPTSAYERIASRNQQVQTLPKTGFPEILAGIFSVGVMISGWSLRKYPK